MITPTAPSGSTPSFFFERTSSADLNPTRWPEEPQLDRLFTTSTAGEFDLLAQASLRQPANPDLIASYAADDTVHSAATTSWFGRSAVSASGAIDSDPSTVWVADPFDQTPTLTIAWDAPQRLTGIHIVGAGAPYRSPSEVIVRTRNGTAQQVKLVDGFAPLSPLHTTKVAVQVVRSAVDFSQATSVIPAAVAVQQITFDGSDDRLDRAAIPNLECGDGPTIKIDDIEIPTRPTGSIRAILAGGPVPLALCGDRSLRLGSGIHRLSETGAGAFALSSFAATNVSATSKSLAKREASVLRWDNSDRVVAVGPGPQTVLSIAENFNEGWTATFLGRELPRVRLDGWHQGWVIPAGDAGEIRLRFQPTSTFRVWLVICVTSFAALGVVALMVARRRRNPQPASTERSVAIWLGDGAAVLALVLMAGVAALIIPIVRRLRPDPLVHSAVAGAAFLMSTVVSAIGNDARPDAAVGAFSGFAQVCCLVAVACVLVALPSDSKSAAQMPRVRRIRPLRPETE